MTNQENENPYVGPRPYRTGESKRFFGRDREARDLIPLVISERLVLFYAQSGAGKSSLINARLIPGLRERNFIVLPVGRVSGEVSGKLEVDNIYMHNLLVSLDREKKPEGDEHAALAGLTLSQYLANLEIEDPVPPEINPSGSLGPMDAPQVIEGVQPLALIIDQFEEIFSTHPEAWRQRGPFFEQLCQAMEADPYLWVVLAIREDYVAALDPFAYLLPGKLRARFYMQRMEYYAALEAVKKPVEKLRPYEDQVAEELVKNLQRITLGEGTEEQIQIVESQYVEPVQLQVVCYQLWENLKDTPGSQITANDLNRLARGGNLAQFISRALGEFYEQSIGRVMQDPSAKISERKLRDWFSKELITESETRGSVFQGETKTGSLPNHVIRLLEAQFIVRSETRASGKWYELSHDRFIAPIMQANRVWLEHNPRPILTDAEAWSQGMGRLYEGRQLATALQQIEASPNEFEPSEVDFIRASEAEENRRRSRRQWVGIALMSFLLIVFAALAVTSFISGRAAVINAAEANIERTRVSEQKETADQASIQEARQARAAETSSALAVEQSHLAQTQSALADARSETVQAYSQELDEQRQAAIGARSTAEAASTLAVIERDRAEQARNQAQAGRLSSLSDYFRTNNLDLSLLLGVEAVGLDDNWNTRGALLDSLQRGLSNTLARDGSPIYAGQRPYSVAFSPNGELLASALNDGSVSVVFVNGRGRVDQIPPEFKSENKANAVAFSADGKILAQGNSSGTVLLWNRDTGNVTKFTPFRITFPHVSALAFQPNGDLLAIATVRESETRRGAVLFYNYKENRVVRNWDCGQYDCTSLAWSPDGKKLAVVNTGGSWKIYDISRQREVMSVDRAHNERIDGVAWYPDNQRLITGGIDRRLVQWDTTNGQILLEADRAETTAVLSMAISPDGRHLLVGASSGTTQTEWAALFDSETLKRLSYQMFQHSQGVPAVAFNPQGNRFVTASFDTSIVLWKFEPVNPLSRFVSGIPGSKIETIFEDSSGGLFWPSLSNGKVTVAGENIDSNISFNSQHSSMAGLRLNGAPVVGMGGYDGQITFVDLATGRPAREPLKMGNGSLRSLAFDSSGSLAAAAVCRGTTLCDQIVIRSLADGQEIALKNDFSKLELGLVTALAFSPDSQRLALGNAKGAIILYNLETGALNPVVTEGLNLQGGSLVITSLAFGPPESDLLAAGFYDKRVALWEASTLGPIGTFSERMNSDVSALMFRKSGPGTDQPGLVTLVAASTNGEVREYDVDIRVWKARACQLADNKNLTSDEKLKFLPDADPEAQTCVN